MKRRKPPEHTRRTVEGMLSKRDSSDEKQTGPARSEPQQEDLVLEPDLPDDTDSYQPIRFEEPEAIRPDPGYSDEPAGGGSKAVTYVLVAVVLIFVVAATLIFAREQILAFLTGGETQSQALHEAKDRLEELEQENKALKAQGNTAEDQEVELANLRSANETLKTELDAARQRVAGLENTLQEARQASAENDPALQDALDEIETLKSQLASADTRAERLQQELDSTLERMVSYTRENAQLNRELTEAKNNASSAGNLRRENERLRREVDDLQRDIASANSQLQVLRSRADQATGADAQLASVNREYRRVLDLLQQSRDANNEKQARIDKLLTENGQLREQVAGMERQVRTDTDARRAGSSTTERQQVAEQRGETRSPIATNIIRPEYPASAIRRKVSGTVRLRVLVDKQGNVIDARVVSSPDPLRSLDRAALSAVRKWQFRPALRNGQPVEAWHSVPMDFTLGS